MRNMAETKLRAAFALAADQAAEMDRIVADGLAAWQRADLIAYHLGFVRAGPATWHRATVAAAPGGALEGYQQSHKGKGDDGKVANRPTAPKLPPQGAANA